ncbi:hypothetical protein AVEN_13249-1 [Araneus ventricosus]|uniref:Uncharacterized protein n=1 Tax=Araneus ventricosus TaxID=182803 RepID=A0A4Y2DKP9_ARAVE|nr:hypothetical protein AVEN_13249-1 [Araneus ventricosus]
MNRKLSTGFLFGTREGCTHLSASTTLGFDDNALYSRRQIMREPLHMKREAEKSEQLFSVIRIVAQGRRGHSDIVFRPSPTALFRWITSSTSVADFSMRRLFA